MFALGIVFMNMKRDLLRKKIKDTFDLLDIAIHRHYGSLFCL